MRNILIISIILSWAFVGRLDAQTPPNATKFYTPTQQPLFTNPELQPGMVRIFPERHHWETSLSWSYADIVTPGVADTSYGDELVYYGKIIQTSKMVGFPSVSAVGTDTADIHTHYRRVAFTTNGLAFGPWIALGDTLTLTTARGSRDTLVTHHDRPPDTLFVNRETGHIQYKYHVVSKKSNLGNGGAADRGRPSPTINWHFRGEIIHTVRRITQ